MNFIVALLTILQSWKYSKCLLSGEWINKTWYSQTMKYYSAMKRNHQLIRVTTYWSTDTQNMTLTKNVKAESEQNKPDGVLYASIIENSEKMPQWLCLSARAPVPIPQTRWLQVQKFICSRFWRLEVGDQGINTVGIFQRPLLAFSRAILSVCPQVAFPVCVCVSWSPPLTGTAVLVE